MTGFWDAIGRAVLGQGGTAAPRPRSLFEPDGADVTFAEEPDVLVDTEPVPQVPAASRPIEAPSDATQPPPRSAFQSFEPPSIDHGSDSRAGSVPTPERRIGAAPERVDVLTIERLGSAAAPQVHVERVEHHHLETTRVVVEPAPLLDVLAESILTNEPPDGAHEPRESGADHSVVSTPADLSLDEPIPVVAAPPVVPAEPAAALASPEPLPPLIVEIEHLDIRITADRVASPPPPPRPMHSPVPSLGEYLARRSEGRR